MIPSLSAQLCGREPLPWEEAEKLAQLQGLKRAALHCLQWRPEDRPSAEEVLLHWRNWLTCLSPVWRPGGGHEAHMHVSVTGACGACESMDATEACMRGRFRDALLVWHSWQYGYGHDAQKEPPPRSMSALMCSRKSFC